jgi:ribonuclease VapC
MIVDASALVAIATGDPEAADLTAEVARAARPVTTPVSLWEATVAIMRQKRVGPATAWDVLIELVEGSNIEVIDLSPHLARRAVDAFARYGKGTGHPARLNMGDCFTYALSASLGQPILYKGDDFAKTDRG